MINSNFSAREFSVADAREKTSVETHDSPESAEGSRTRDTEAVRSGPDPHAARGVGCAETGTGASGRAS